MSEAFDFQLTDSFSRIHIEGKNFKDESGRTLFLRGVNVVAKEPAVCPDNVKFCGDNISFVHANMPLEEADEHFARIAYAGFTIIRLLVTWEAICPSMPDEYDEHYLKYIQNLCQKATAHNISVILDFHQDVFSRYMSGCGAPKWILEKVGLNPDNFEQVGAAIFPKKEDKYPHIAWYTNNFRFAAATMNTLFFAGKHFAPNFMIDGLQVQEYLQSHFEKALLKLVSATKDIENIFAIDIWNEPSMGFAGCEDASKYFGFYRLKEAPSPFDSMIAADGNTVSVPYFFIKWFNVRNLGLREINIEKKRAWQAGRECVFKQEGVWEYNENGEPILRKKDYFATIKGSPVNITRDLYLPFIKRMTKSARKISSELTVLVQHLIGHNEPVYHDKELTNIIFSAHWYDGIVMSLKKAFQFLAVDFFSQKLTIALPHKIRRILAKQVHKLRHNLAYHYPEVPFMITEIGVSHDINNRRAYRLKTCKSLIRMIQRSIRAAEDNVISYVAWCYNVRNTLDQGDRFNGEDFSIWSRDLFTDPKDPYSGFKQPEALIRPYIRAVPGKIIDMHFCVWKKEFTASFAFEDSIDKPVEVFIPNLHYAKGVNVEHTPGKIEIDQERQLLYFYPEKDTSLHSLGITAA